MLTGREDGDRGSRSDWFVAGGEHMGVEDRIKTTTGSMCVSKDGEWQDGEGGALRFACEFLQTKGPEKSRQLSISPLEPKTRNWAEVRRCMCSLV